MAEEFDEAIRKPLLAYVPEWIHPNHISILRAVLLAPLIVYRDDPTIAVGIILLSSACDLLDGPLARLRGQKSEEGAVLDATSDKIFLNGAAFYVCNQALPEPVRWTALGIDLFLTLIRPLKERYGVSTSSNRWGGGKVWAYSIGVGLACLHDSSAIMLAHAVYLVGIALAILSVGGHLLDIFRAFDTEASSS